MSKHQYDLIHCMRRQSNNFGMVCQYCAGRCPICDSFVNSKSKVRICKECAVENISNKCIICRNFLGDSSHQASYAYFCSECVVMEKHVEGCPRIINYKSFRHDNTLNKKKLLDTLKNDSMMM